MPGTTELIQYVAFYDDERHQPILAFAPRRAENSAHAIRAAKVLAQSYDGAVAWRRNADPTHGELGPSEILFSSGRIGDFD